jgi:antirestriction protein ArdC
MMTTTKQRMDIYAEITQQILNELTSGACPWHRPWDAEHVAGNVTRPLRHSGQRYQGINVLTLWLTAVYRAYRSPYWMTFNQVKSLGGTVRKGERGARVVYSGSMQKPAVDEDREEQPREVRFLKTYHVFCADQCDGLPTDYHTYNRSADLSIEPVSNALQFFAATGARIEEAGTEAHYLPETDVVRVPPLHCFDSPTDHASTLAHELIHWTGHESRLNRQLNQNRYGDEAYAMEELVAELGAAFLAADLGIAPFVRPCHASYINSWIRVLENDHRAIFTAASLANKAVEYLHQRQPLP